VSASAVSLRTYVAIVGLFALAALFATLGAWQVRRADLNRSTRAQFASGAAEATVDLPRELHDDLRFRRVEVRGELVAAPQFLLDNMLHDGVAGYHVLTALRVAGRSEHVLVNRGWVATGGDRRVLPDVDIEGGMRTVVGRLERLPRPGLRLGADDPGDAAAVPVAVLQYPTAAELARRLGQPVYDFEVLLDAAEPDGFVREWQPPGVPPERNVAYAGQWFALCLGALAAAVVMAFRTTLGSPRRGTARRTT
jgi:surfeit locus 1 family protein